MDDERVSSAELLAQHQARMAKVPGTFENREARGGRKTWFTPAVVIHQLLIVVVGLIFTAALAWCLGHKYGIIPKALSRSENKFLSTELSLKESYQFFAFDAVRWQIRRDLYKTEMMKQIRAPRPPLDDDQEWAHYLKHFFKPTFSCPSEVPLSKGTGRVCEPLDYKNMRSCLIYNAFGQKQKSPIGFSQCMVYDIDVDSDGLVVHGYHRQGKNGRRFAIEHRLGHIQEGALVSAAAALGHAGLLLEILIIGPNGYSLTLLQDLDKVFVRQVVVEVPLDASANPFVRQEAVTVFDFLTTSLGYVVFQKAVRTTDQGGKVITFGFLRLHDEFSTFTSADMDVPTDPEVLKQFPSRCEFEQFVAASSTRSLNITIASNFRSPSHVMDEDSWRHKTQLVAQNHLKYVKEHGMNYFAPECDVAFKYHGFENPPKDSRVVNWDKFAIIQYLFDSGADAVVWLDPSTVLAESSEDIGRLLQGSAGPDFVFTGDGLEAFDSRSFIIRNTIWSQTLLKEAYQVCPAHGSDNGAFLTILGGASPGDAETWKAQMKPDGLLSQPCCRTSMEAEIFQHSMPQGVRRHVQAIPWSKMGSYLKIKGTAAHSKYSQMKGASFLQEATNNECQAGV